MYSNSISVSSSTDWTKLPPHLGLCLEEVRASTVVVNSDCVTFTSTLFRRESNWNVLVPFGFGELCIDSNLKRVVYRVSYKKLMVLFAFPFALFAVIPIYLHDLRALALLPLEWLAFVGVNLFLGLIRFHRFVKRSVETAPQIER